MKQPPVEEGRTTSAPVAEGETTRVKQPPVEEGRTTEPPVEEGETTSGMQPPVEEGRTLQRLAQVVATMGRHLRRCNRCQADASYICSDFCLNRDCVWISVFSFSCNEDITSGCDIIRSVRNLSSVVQIRHLLEVDFVCLLDV